MLFPQVKLLGRPEKQILVLVTQIALGKMMVLVV